MAEIKHKHMVAILRVLRDAGGPLGSSAISRRIQAYGVSVSDRTVRWYLQEMQRKGLVTKARRGRVGGTMITDLGIDEIKGALVTSRVGFTAAKVDTLAWRMSFDLMTRKGQIALNVSLIDQLDIFRAVDEMTPVFESGLGMGEYALYAKAGERIGDLKVPEGKAAIGSVCSVTVNGVLLKAGIPTVSRFGGVLEMNEGRPVRFTDMIYYDGTSLDPLEIFIKGGLTSVRDAVATGRGRIGAGFREVPTAALGEVEQIDKLLRKSGLGAILVIGAPNQPLLDFPVQEGRTGIVLAGGLNPAAAVEEAGIPTTNFALSCLVDIERMVRYTRLGPVVRHR